VTSTASSIERILQDVVALSNRRREPPQTVEFLRRLLETYRRDPVSLDELREYVLHQFENERANTAGLGLVSIALEAEASRVQAAEKRTEAE